MIIKQTQNENFEDFTSGAVLCPSLSRSRREFSEDLK